MAQTKIQVITTPKYFPTFADIPGDHEYDDRYYVGSVYRKNWILLGEIIEASTLLRPRIVARDSSGREFVVALYPDDRNDIQRILPNFKVGNTVALAHALGHFFMDGSAGVRLEEMDEITLDDLVKLNAHAIKHNWFVEEKTTCHGCNLVKDNMSRCGGCKVVQYCSQECQVKGWKENGHKSQCKTLKDPDIKYMFQLDYGNYNHGFGFGPHGWKGRQLTEAEKEELNKTWAGLRI